jgi:hypothetical protein
MYLLYVVGRRSKEEGGSPARLINLQHADLSVMDFNRKPKKMQWHGQPEFGALFHLVVVELLELGPHHCNKNAFYG